jgi:YD repeat-containing protein
VSTKTVTITDPRGDVTVNTFGTQYAVDEGFVLSSSEGVTGSGALRTTTFGYAPTTAGPYPASFGGLLPPGAGLAASHRPLNQRTITQQGVSFSRSISNFDIYVRPVALTRSSSLGYSRSESTTYFDHTNLWVLGQVASRTIAGVTASSTTFKATNAVPETTYKFGKLQATYVFNTDGTMYSLTDGRNQTTTFTNYKRGLPQNIAYADGTGVSAVVNNIGTIDKATNEVGTFWTFTYDAMGRIASKTPPAGDTVAYNPTTFSFVQVPAAEVGLEANHWRQTITTGNAVTVNYFDARWRKRLTTTYDASDRANTERAQRLDYDPYNRTTFASYPVRSIVAITMALPGTVTNYDVLGNQTQAVADSELGALTTTTQYLAGFQKRVIDARGNATTIAYQVFDQPAESAITSIWAPEGLNVAITRDVFGKPTSITRSGTYAGAPISATRSYVYDANQLLCKTIEPEIGATVQALDMANNVAWRAPGVNLPNTASCDWAGVPESSKIAFSYDARNRLTGTGFGDGGPSIGRSYTLDGLPMTVVSNGSTWTYGYNNRRLLTSESLVYGQTFNIGRSYDANGNLTQLNYPDYAAVAFSPNALGEARQVSGYASGVAYHPNGAVAGYTLANGIAHTLSQNLRGLPLVNRDAGIVQDQYGYDANGNIAAIADQQEGITNRSMAYDGLDRLTSASAPGVWGSAIYSYDVLDNVRTSTVGGRNSTHNYGSNNLLATIATNGVYTGYAYDARGNVTGRGMQGFYFDLGNRMALANGVASYVYDGWGRRAYVSGSNGVARTQVYSNAGGQLLYGFRQQGMTTATTRYVYLGGKLIAETDSVLAQAIRTPTRWAVLWRERMRQGN